MRLSIPLFVLLVVGCTTSTAGDSPYLSGSSTSIKAKKDRGDKNTIVVRVKKSKSKCSLPDQPKALARPLPIESPKTMIDLLTIKLSEWISWGNKVEKSCR